MLIRIYSALFILYFKRQVYGSYSENCNTPHIYCSTQLLTLPNGSDRCTFQPTLHYSSGCLQHVTCYELLEILTSRTNQCLLNAHQVLVTLITYYNTKWLLSELVSCCMHRASSYNMYMNQQDAQNSCD